MINVISLGAGKQSSYMLLNALDGAYKYRPDFAIFSDTGCEPKYVYEYVESLIHYVKDKYNFDIITVSAGNLQQDVLDYIEGRKGRVAALPLKLGMKDSVFTDSNGEEYAEKVVGGLLMRQCTADYKIAPLRKYLQSVRGKNRVRLWVGISLDEMERMKDAPVKYIEHWYPLVENRITIDQIVNWFKENGMREPGKSACLICPFHSDNYWRVFKKQFPEEFEAACVFDDKIRDYPNLRSKAYLSSHRRPLREIDFTQQPSLFPELIEECEGLCGL